jgi:hypothetical protein
MVSFESRHVIHPSKDMAEEWAARVERRGVKFRSATSGRYVAQAASSGEVKPAISSLPQEQDQKPGDKLKGL